MGKGYSEGRTIHKTKASAMKVAKSCRATGVKYRIVKLANGYRVDKKY